MTRKQRENVLVICANRKKTDLFVGMSMVINDITTYNTVFDNSPALSETLQFDLL